MGNKNKYKLRNYRTICWWIHYTSGYRFWTPTALAVSDGSTGATLSHRVIEFTGSISGARVVTIPLDVQTFYIIKNSTSGAYTLQFKYVSGSGDYCNMGCCR